MNRLCLLFYIWYLGIVWCDEFNFLAIGDSFERIYVNEWCEENINAHHDYPESTSDFKIPHGVLWGDMLFRDQSRHNTPFFCRDSSNNNTVAQIQFFGSNMEGPYDMDRNLPSETTIFRVTSSLASYFKLIDALPDRIMIHTTQWDVIYPYNSIWHGFPPNKTVWEDFLSLKEKEIHSLLNLVEHIVSTEKKRRQDLQLTSGTTSVDYFKFEVDIALRSTTRQLPYDHLLIDFNHMVHKISIERNLTWFDLDADFWSAVDFHRTPEYYKDPCPSLFRDGVHSSPAFSVPTLNKMLGAQYTQFLYLKGTNKPHSHIVTNHAQLHSAVYKNLDFQLVRAIAVDQQHSSNEHLTHSEIYEAACKHPKNLQIPPITDLSITELVHSIPGYGPLYYSMFVNGSRVKWLVGDVSATYHAQHIHQQKHAIHSNSTLAETKPLLRHRGRALQILHMTNKEYELAIRPILEHMLLSVGDLVLLSEPLLDAIPTQGVLFIVFKSDTLSAFTTSNTNNNETSLHIVTTDGVVRHVPQTITSAMHNLLTQQLNIPITRNIDIHLLLRYKIRTKEMARASLFQEKALIRYVHHKSVQIVLNLTRYDIALNVFQNRGYEFSDVIVYDDSEAVYVTLLKVGGMLWE